MKRYNVNPLTMMALIPIVIAIVIFAPLVVIWALNTLFNLGIAYNFWTWLAMTVLTGTFGKPGSIKIKKD